MSFSRRQSDSRLPMIMFSVADYAIAGAVFFAAIGSQFAANVSEGDVVVSSAIYVIAAGWLYLISKITGQGGVNERLPGQTRGDWFLQEAAKHGDYWISASLFWITIADFFLPVGHLQFIAAVSAGAWILGMGMLIGKIERSHEKEPVRPIFVRAPKHLEDLAHE